jgi:hypothetical protein
MTPTQLAAAIVEVQLRGKLTDSQMASGLVAMVIHLCEKNHMDPLQFMQWAILTGEVLSPEKPS